MRRLVFCMLFLVFISSIVIAQEIPTLEKYVNDNANVLSSSDIARINALAAHIEENTTVQIAVLTVSSTEPMTIEQYAVEVFEKAGIGFEDKDNGLLIVVAINDRKWRLEVGYGLEPIITDSTAGLIGRTYMTPAFREERYGDGIYDAVEAIYAVIQNSGDTSFISEQIDIEFILPLIIIVIVLIFLIMVFASVFAAPKCPKCGGRMKCHVKGDYIICECKKCKKKIKKKRKKYPFWFFFFVGSGRGGGGFGGGGGGFGGGSSGGGGASGGW